MRERIRAIKQANGKYIMVATGTNELPQGGWEHTTARSVYRDAAVMYASSVWQYDPRDHTIDISIDG